MNSKQRRTPFGSMLVNYRYQKERLIKKVVSAMILKHDANNKYGNLTEDYEVRETKIDSKDGETIIKVELWKRLEVERVKISTSVLAEKIEDDVKVETQDDDWLK